MSSVRRLIWDIEIVPNEGTFWESGWRQRVPWTNITKERQICCICAKWENGKQVYSWDWGKEMDDGPLLTAFAEVANSADELVAHNGDKYDRRMFAGRCLKHGVIIDPDIKQFDTYQVAKRRFKLNSYSLKYLCHYLGLDDNKDEMHYEDWMDVLNGKQKALRKMVKYCKKDVVLTEQVFKRIEPYHNPKTHAGTLGGSDKWSCPHCGSENVWQNKKRFTAKGTVQFQFQCLDCHSFYTISSRAQELYHEYRHG